MGLRYQHEYRDPVTVQRLLDRIRTKVTHRWRIMEICGGQTHTIVKEAIDRLLPSDIDLIHGPGCPVCVTPIERIDQAIALAQCPEVTLCSFGDMLRVPGSQMDLLSVKALGGDVRMVYSPLDALALARRNPNRQIVFFAVGFETTAPANAMAVWQAARTDVENFSLLVSHVTVPAAIEALLSDSDNVIDGFLAAGHVCTVMGYEEYFPLAERFCKPIVVTGFEVVDILHGVLMAVEQLEQGRAEVENQYARSVRREGNPQARAVIDEVFETSDQIWRGLGMIPRSGYRLSADYAAFDAMQRFNLKETDNHLESECQSGLILQGRMKPPECPAFGMQCTPDHPLGAPMVSSEGACAAYYRYARHAESAAPLLMVGDGR